MEPILRAIATNNLLPLERVELKCERYQINKIAYEYLLTFIKKSTTLQHFSMLSSEITAHKLQELLHSVNRDFTLTFKLLENLGLDGTVNNLQKLKHGISKYVSNDEIVSFERLGVSQEKDIFTVPDLNYEQNNESASHDDSACHSQATIVL
jgi:hypothetical protein